MVLVQRVAGYRSLARDGLPRAGEWAWDGDGEGIREVHVNTLEGLLWTGLRNFLRPFRGVNKVYPNQYVVMFEWSDNVKLDRSIHYLCGRYWV